METVEGFSEFLRKIGATNFLAIAIVILVLWLVLSGVIRGLRKKRDHKEEED
jgi:Na+/H+ antiporter NhaD/arsenite permease-like protein